MLNIWKVSCVKMALVRVNANERCKIIHFETYLLCCVLMLKFRMIFIAFDFYNF